MKIHEQPARSMAISEHSHSLTYFSSVFQKKFGSRHAKKYFPANSANFSNSVAVKISCIAKL